MSADDDRRRSGPLRPADRPGAARPSGVMPTVQRPAPSGAMPTMQRPAPSGAMPTVQRPAPSGSMPSGSMPTMQRPAPRPSGPVAQQRAPAQQAPAQPRRPSRQSGSTAAPNRPRGKLVLVVEDDEKTRRLLGHVMHKGGYRVALAEDGIKAAGVLKKARPDLIVLDLRMPRMDGFQLLGLLQRFKSAASIPVVVLTASDSPIDLDRALQLGVADYLQKPISPKALLLKVRALLKATA